MQSSLCRPRERADKFLRSPTDQITATTFPATNIQNKESILKKYTTRSLKCNSTTNTFVFNKQFVCADGREVPRKLNWTERVWRSAHARVREKLTRANLFCKSVLRICFANLVETCINDATTTPFYLSKECYVALLSSAIFILYFLQLYLASIYKRDCHFQPVFNKILTLYRLCSLHSYFLYPSHIVSIIF